MEFSLEIQGKQFGTLRFDNRDILFDDLILKAADLFVAEISVVHRYVHPDGGFTLTYSRDREDHGKT